MATPKPARTEVRPVAVEPPAISAPPAAPVSATAAAPRPAAAAPPPDYLAAIQARLARFKVYPRSAQIAREEGVVRVRFVVAADGSVLDWRIVDSSGFDSLDHAAEAMIERASPLPPIPPELGRNRMEIVLPVRFALR